MAKKTKRQQATASHSHWLAGQHLSSLKAYLALPNETEKDNRAFYHETVRQLFFLPGLSTSERRRFTDTARYLFHSKINPPQRRSGPSFEFEATNVVTPMEAYDYKRE